MWKLVFPRIKLCLRVTIRSPGDVPRRPLEQGVLAKPGEFSWSCLSGSIPFMRSAHRCTGTRNCHRRSLEKYKVGLFLLEPTFCDVTYKLSGFIAPHRLLFISSNARCLDGIGEDLGWGLCIFQRNRIFKVIDKIQDLARTQITLLEVPDDLVEFFSRSELNDLVPRVHSN